ncbi:MAG: ester cyclase [Chromatiales bacterium]|nr:ester cyclase [Chromatiales bacterium]
MLKRHLIITFILLSVTSPIGFTSEKQAPNSVLQVLDQYLAAWKTRDLTQIGKLYADDVSVFDLPSDTLISGKENVLKFEEEVWLANAPDMVWVRTSQPLASGNSVTYEWIYAGTYSGAWGDIQIENRPFSVKGISTTTINDEGKIIMQRDFYDLKSFERELGL